MKLVAAIIGDSCGDTLRLCFDSIINDVDKIFFIWGKDCIKTKEILNEYEDKYPSIMKVINKEYPHDKKGGEGIQRNVYLKAINDWKVETNITDDIWVLVVDSDEVMENVKNLREFLEVTKHKVDVYNLLTYHLIGDLVHVDSVKPAHYTPSRLFKFKKEAYYPEICHVVVHGYDKHMNCDIARMWHLAHCKDMFGVLRRHKRDIEKSTMHSPQFLHWWYLSHVIGKYPTKELDMRALPKIIKDEFMLNDIISDAVKKNGKKE